MRLSIGLAADLLLCVGHAVSDAVGVMLLLRLLPLVGRQAQANDEIQAVQ